MNDREKANPVISEETGGREDYQNEKLADGADDFTFKQHAGAVRGVGADRGTATR